MSEKIVLIIVDNLRIGGVQRLALDQLFILSDLGISAEIHFRQLEATLDNPNFLSLESNRILKKNLTISSMPKSRITQLFYLIRLMQKNHFSDVINLSLGSTVFLRIAKLLSNRRSKIHTIIEQLATLSAPRQRRKRFLYSSWTDNLYGGSQAIVWDWNYWLNNYFFLRNLLKKRPLIHRNGVYLDRLPTLANNLNIEELSKKNRIIFVGRNVAWKSPELILSILQTYQKQDLRALFILPSFDRNLVDNLKREFESRIDFEFGKGIEDIVFREGDIHVYPANYGPDAKFTESVSINCLEMACLGIPSLVTENGTQTWPELVEMGLLIEVDWNNFESINISIQKAVDFSATESIISSAREIISVKRNIINLLNL